MNNDNVKFRRAPETNFLIIDEIVFDKLSPYALKIYGQLRKVVSYTKECDQVALSIKSISISAKCSERQVYKALNELEFEHFIIKRTNSENFKYGQTNKFIVSQTYNYFAPCQSIAQSTPVQNLTTPAQNAVPPAQNAVLKIQESFQDTTTPSLPAVASSNSSSNQEITPVELLEVYEEILPDNPKPIRNLRTGELDPGDLKTIGKFKKDWAFHKGMVLTKPIFRIYLEMFKNEAPMMSLEPYKQPTGKFKINGLRFFINWFNYQKFMEGYYK